MLSHPVNVIYCLGRAVVALASVSATFVLAYTEVPPCYQPLTIDVKGAVITFC